MQKPRIALATGLSRSDFSSAARRPAPGSARRTSSQRPPSAGRADPGARAAVPRAHPARTVRVRGAVGSVEHAGRSDRGTARIRSRARRGPARGRRLGWSDPRPHQRPCAPSQRGRLPAALHAGAARPLLENAAGVGGLEGGPPIFDLAALCQQAGAGAPGSVYTPFGGVTQPPASRVHTTGGVGSASRAAPTEGASTTAERKRLA
jgi:hypothetical protein